MTEKMKQMEEKIKKIVNKEQILKEKNEIGVKEYKNNIATSIINMPLSEEERITMIKDPMVNATVKYYCAYSLSDKAKVKILDYFTENEKLKLKNDGKLADLAPTILDLMNIEIPDEMTGESLLEKD